MEEINEQIARAMFSFIECPNQQCKNQMVVEPGEIDYNMKDNDGKPMTK